LSASNWLSMTYASRILSRSPGFSLRVILPIALGISSATIVFSAFDAVILRALPYPGADRLVVIRGGIASVESSGPLPTAEINDIRRQATSFEAIGSFKKSTALMLSTEERFEPISGVLVSGDFFATIGSPPILGRWLAPEDNDPASSSVAVVSYSLWRSTFAADPKVVGSTIRLENKPFRIVGVMGPEFRFPESNTKVWTPEPQAPDVLTDRMLRDQSVIARLRPAVKQETAQAELSTIAYRVGRKFPESEPDLKLTIGSIQQQVVGSVKDILSVILGAAISILLIACANVSNLFLIRNASSQREIAIRLAMGATRMRLFQHLLAESVMLACLGGALGIVACAVGIRFLRTAGAVYLDSLRYVSLNATVLGCAFLLSLLTGILFGTVPAWLATRTELNASMKNRDWNPGGSIWTLRGRLLRNAFVLVQITVAVVLAMSATWLLRSFVNLTTHKLGFDPANLQVIQIPSRSDLERSLFFRHIVGEAASLPGVESASLISNTPFSGFSTSIVFGMENSGSQWIMGPPIEFRSITPNYFQTMKIPILLGRGFNEDDRKGTACVVVANKKMVSAFWPDGNVLTRRIDLNGLGKSKHYYCSIVGVAGDSRDIALEREPIPLTYFPDLQFPQGSYTLLLRSKKNVSGLASSLLQRVQQLDPGERFVRAVSLEAIIENLVSGTRFRAQLAFFFAALALAISSLAVYGTTAYSASQQTHEIGVRIALGAQPRSILTLVIRDALIVASIAVGLGITGTFALKRVLGSYLFEVKQTDAVSLGIVLVAVSSSCLLASYLPARKATRIDPKLLLLDN